MKKFLSDTIPWEQIKAIGFDLDGTLYDEFSFISQVYSQIAQEFILEQTELEEVLSHMLNRWLEKGSSYPHIFDETLDFLKKNTQEKKELVNQALLIFRNFTPNLTLSPRIRHILKVLSKEFELFLVTDGNSILQRNKLRALGIEEYFLESNIFISGDYGKDTGKPSLFSLENIQILKEHKFSPNQIVFIGDRKVDKDYARNAGFYFIQADKLNQSIL